MALLDHKRLIVNQKAKLVELTNEYAIRDEAGNQVGSIRQEGQSRLRKLARLVTSVDQFLTHRLAVYEADGSKLLELVRPRKILRSSFEVTDGGGMPVGTIVQENLFGKKRFAMKGQAGEELGSINAQNWRAWDFRIHDAAGGELGKISKKWSGLGKELFTSADNYVIEIEDAAQGPTRLMALASASAIDTALKQDAGGFN